MNTNLINAKNNKNDEFYTQLSDIIKELKHYKDKFRDKVIYLPCDNPDFSQFFYYFYNKFKILGLKKLIASFYSPKSLFGNGRGDSFVTIVDKGKKVIKIKLKGDGDFRSKELIPFWKEADIIVTNPPFSLFHKFMDTIFWYNKKFIVLGPISNINKDILDKMKIDKVRLGYNSGDMNFINGDECISLGNIAWFLNLDRKLNPLLELTQVFDNNKYPKYINYDAINVDKIKDIPKDYFGVMGVPITFLTKYNPNQFEIIEFSNTGCQNYINSNRKMEVLKNGKRTGELVTNGKSNVYILFNSKLEKYPSFVDIETGELYLVKFRRVMIKRRK